MSHTLTLDGKTYEVRALFIEDIEDMLGKDGFNFGLELFKRAVFVNGKAIGNDAKKVPLKHFTRLTKLVNELNGSTEDEDKKD